MTTHTQIAVATNVMHMAQQIGTAMEELISQLMASAPTDNAASLKRSDGRMTEAGIDALYADFAAKELSNEAIAEKYQISMSGTVKRKAMWKKGER